MRLIVTTFLFLGWGFYELSGGADFEPEQRPIIVRIEPEITPDPLPEPEVEAVTQASIAPQIEEIIPVPEDPISAPAALVVVSNQQTVEEIKPEEPTAETTALENALAETLETAIGQVLDIRIVDKERVNVRSGPGTEYDIAARLVAGDETQVLEDLGNGWVQVLMSDGNTGWMADFLLTPKSEN